MACRLYPLGLEREADGSEKYVQLEPAPGSLGLYGDAGTMAEFLAVQGVDDYMAANEAYRHLLLLMRERIAMLVDFERIEPREFWRIATREALAEANYDPNPLIDSLFDADGFNEAASASVETISVHRERIESLVRRESNVAKLAAAAVMLAVSLGYGPREVI